MSQGVECYSCLPKTAWPPTCCGQPMQLFTENTVDAAVEKHIPVVEAVDGGVSVKVGAVEHPMLDNHYIEWIEVITENKVYRKHLKPGEKPEVVFATGDETIVTVREYCNLHKSDRSHVVL